MTRTIWRIGHEDGPSPELPDNYKAPLAFPDVTWTVGGEGNVWPLYQASEADPGANYQAQSRTIRFELPSVDAPAYEPTTDYLVIAPRVPLPHLSDPSGGLLAEVSDNVTLSVLKAACDGRGVILRVQDLRGSSQEAFARFPPRRITRAALTDLLETDLTPLPISGDAVHFSVPAWGLATVRVEFEPPSPLEDPR